MVDLLIGAAVVASVFTGYVRGVARELIELVAMFIAIPVAFRVGPTVLAAFTELPEANRALIGGFVALMAVMLAVGLAARAAERAGMIEPPSPPDRIAGGVVGFARSLTLAWVVVTALAGAPSTVFATATGESQIASALTSDAAVTAFSSLTGNQDVRTLIEFNRQYPNGPLVSDNEYELPAFERDRLEPERDLAAEMLTLVNVSRAELGEAPLQWSGPLAEVVRGVCV